MKLNKLIFLIFLISIFIPAVSAFQISGYITDASTGNRITGASVSSNDWTDLVVTDAQGHFTMSRDYPVGTYYFTAYKNPEYVSTIISVRIVGYDVTNANGAISPNPNYVATPTPTPIPTPVPDNGNLQIKSNVPAFIIVDGVLAGNSNPDTYLTYITTAGSHHITANALDGKYIQYSADVMVKSDKNANPFTYLIINLIPTNPAVTAIAIPTISVPNLPGSGFGGFSWPEFTWPEFNWPDLGCIFGCNPVPPAPGNPFGGFNWPEFKMPAMPDFGGCWFWCGLFPAAPNNGGSTGNYIPTTGGSGSNITSTPLPQNTYSFWWILLIIAIVVYYYYKKQKKHHKRKK